MIVDYKKSPGNLSCLWENGSQGGVDGLANLVQESFNLEPYLETLFLFCGNRSGRYKPLYFMGVKMVL